jgi:hypothetical protein
MLPGLDAHGQALCTLCAPGLGDFICRRCDQEGPRYHAGTCTRCVLRERLDVILDRGDGQILPTLQPLYDSLAAMPRPRSGLLWLSRKPAPAILRTLARRQVPLTHDGLSSLSPPQSVTYVRDLLVACEVLPPADRYLLMFQQWLSDWQETIRDPEHAAILTRYAQWDILRRLNVAAASAPIGYYRDQNARERLRQAKTFLTYLKRRRTHLTACTQADLDRWAIQASTPERAYLQPFLRWSRNSNLITRIRLPPTQTSTPIPIDVRQQLQTLRRILTDARIPTDDRIIAMLIALYAQPLPRIVVLTLDDVIHTPDPTAAGTNTGTVFIRLGDPPSPVPPPLDQLLLEHIATRTNQTTATNPTSRLLFPGRRAGQPIHPTTARLRLNALGITNLINRRSALHQLIQNTPAPVVAGMLGYSSKTTEKIRIDTGLTWARYAHIHN